MSIVRCPSCGAPATGIRFCGVCGMRLTGPVTTVGTAAAQSGYTHVSPGMLLDRRYRVLSALASGSMGSVYRAEDLRLGGRVRAIKEMLHYWGSAEERSEAELWFRREGETLMSLQHPAIPVVHDTFSEGARHYLVMDLVEGSTLEQILAVEGTPGLQEGKVVVWAEEILDVLSYLHSRSDPLIFRDLKPANIILTPESKIRLIDFGIARVFTQRTQGTAIGTPGYAPPEQYQGLAEPASDLYALGATLHHLLTGRDPRKSRPFDFPAVRMLAPEVTNAVAGAVDRSLSLDPRARHGTAAEMRKALRGTAALDASTRRSVSGSLSLRPVVGSGSMPALATKVAPPATLDPADGSVVQVGPRAVRLHPNDLQIACVGGTILTRAERRTVRLSNRTKKRLLCSFDSDVPWLQPDRPAAWLEPHSKLEVLVHINWADPAVGDHRGALRVQGGGQAWNLPVSLKVRGAQSLVLHSTVGFLMRLASFCITIGVVATGLGFVGINVLSHDVAWDLLVVGLVGVVLLSVFRSAKGH